MKRLFGAAALALVTVLGLTPALVSADNMSSTQIITITATVAPARSIVVNDEGQMTRIYSNTDKNVTPKVYRNKAPGPEVQMTPALQRQYDNIMARPGSKVGVSIDVPIPPKPLSQRLSAALPALSALPFYTLTHL